MNIFKNQKVAQKYDLYYESIQGKEVDLIEKAMIRSFLPKVTADDMLELGCGTGHWTQFFCEEGFHVIAVDESTPMLKKAQSKNISNACFLKANASNLPYSEHAFSIISAVTMFEFVEDTQAVFNEINRVLKPGGFLLTGWLNALSEIGLRKEQSKTFRHANFYSKEEITTFMLRFGTPQLSYGVYYSSGFELLDNLNKRHDAEPAFVVSLVQKCN